MPRPDGYPTVSPYLICPRADEVISFAERGLGAKLLRRFPAPDGSVMHAEIELGGSVVMIGDAGESWPAVPTHLHVYVDDVDVAYASAIASGGEALEPPKTHDDGDRRGGVKDPGGNTWWLAS